MSKQITVSPEKIGYRLDTFIADAESELSRMRVQKMIKNGRVRVNDLVCYDKNYRLQNGDKIGFSIPEPEDAAAQPEQIELDIVYEDQDLLVINKPRAMVVHPAPGHPSGTLVNALLYHCQNLSGIGGVIRPGIVHRLDKDTSGLLIVAKNDLAHSELSAQLKSRQLGREYLALVHGQVQPKAGRIEVPIGRDRHDRKKMAAISGGRAAITRYRVRKYFDHHSLLHLFLETGRTHQIRVHLAYIGFPVVGDPTYAKVKRSALPVELTKSQLLHAWRIVFTHPRSAVHMAFSVPLPEYYRDALFFLNKNDRTDSV